MGFMVYHLFSTTWSGVRDKVGVFLSLVGRWLSRVELVFGDFGLVSCLFHLLVNDF